MKIVVTTVIILAILLFGASVYRSRLMGKSKDTIVTTGLTKGQTEYFQEALIGGVEFLRIIKKGETFMSEGRYDAAIEIFKEAHDKAKWQGDKAITVIYTANAYEKKRDYKKALGYIIIDRDEYVNNWAKEPISERAKYLEYASKGEYELAIQHAKKAIEENNKITSIKTNPSQDYIERLADLIAAKDYILSLKESSDSAPISTADEG